MSFPLQALPKAARTERSAFAGDGCVGDRRRVEVETFIQPSGDAADHLFDWIAQRGKFHRSLVRAVAMRPGAIDHEQSVFE